MKWMIEVGEALGYDVKGCRKSLRKCKKRVWIKELCFKHNVHILGVQETKMSKSKVQLRSMWEVNQRGLALLFLDATIFNSFMHDTDLIDLLMDGRHFTWVNKVGSKMSKLDCFLILYDVLHSNTDLKVVALDRLWSNHNPILLHYKKNDFFPIPFKIFNSWFDRIEFEDIVKEKWAAISDLEQSKPLHTQLKDLKSYLKLWMQELEDLEKLESMDLVQKSRVKWEVEGDENLKFFHGLINSRRKSQMVQGIMLDGVLNSDPKDIKSAFLDFYKDKFSCHNFPVLFPLILAAHRLSIANRDFLESMVSMDEIKVEVWDCGSQKALRPDGYSFKFIKKLWDLLKNDIQSFVIVAKILDNRLSKVIDSIISPKQSAIITRRKILDGPLILRETINWYNKRKKKMMLFKVNFEKVFDSVSWRDLRQGDTLSPFLFIIVMEGLHMALNDGLDTNMFHGVKVDFLGMYLSHLFYADDVIILSEWNLNAMENIIRILNIFYIAFWLKINIYKSNVYGVRVSSNEVEIMASYTGYKAGFFPFTYLGLPIGLNMSRIMNWQPLTNHFKVSETVVKSLKSLRASFFWGSFEDFKKLVWVKWSNILASLNKIDLSVGSLKAFNMSLLLKWRWRLFHNSNSLWVHVVKAIYGDEAGIDIRGCHINGVGDGSFIRFGKDTYRPVNVGRTKGEFNALNFDIASLEPKELVDSDTCIWSLSHDDKFLVNSVTKHIDKLSLSSLSPISTASTSVSTGSRVSTISREDENHDENANIPPPVPPTQQAPHTLSTIKLPIMKKDTNGQIRVLPPKTVNEILARERERKARTTLLMSIPEDHLVKFHKMTDTKELWEAIKYRFGGNDESKKMQKYILKQQFESFSVSNSEGLHKGYDKFQSLLSQLKIHGAGVSIEDANQKFLRVFEPDVKRSTRSSSSTQNFAFVSSSTSSTNDVSTAYGVSTSFGHNSQKEGSSSYTDELTYSFFTNQSSGPQLDHEDLEQVDDFDLEEMDLKWQVAMISMRLKKFYNKTGRKLQSKGNQESRRRDAGNTGYKVKDNGRRPRKQEEPKALVTLDGDGVDWTGHAEDEQENFDLMAYSNSGSDTEVTSCSKECVESYAKLKKLYDEQREQLGDSSIEIQAYTQALKKKLLAEAVKEKEELKAKLENIQSSSKGLSKLLNSQMSAKDKSGLGYGDQIHEGVSSYENEVLECLFDSRSSDVEDSPVNDRFAKVKGLHAVFPPMTGIYMPSKYDFGIDESKFTYGPKQSKTSESDAKTSNFASCESNSSVETLESYESDDSDDEYMIKPSKEQEKPSFAFVNTIKHVKTPRETVKEQKTCSPSPKADKRDMNGLMSKRLGLGYGFTRKACPKADKRDINFFRATNKFDDAVKALKKFVCLRMSTTHYLLTCGRDLGMAPKKSTRSTPVSRKILPQPTVTRCPLQAMIDQDGRLYPQKNMLCGKSDQVLHLSLLAGALDVVEFPRRIVGHDVAMFLRESDKVERYVGGLPDMIHGKQEEKLTQPQAPTTSSQEAEMWVNAYAAGTGERKEYAGTLSLCNSESFTRIGSALKMRIRKRVGH
ncbi:ribonuclease H-like domain-containing protein [Tanacetum coccineum]|uniref:Ribonuclease H-like domain-containing protein n=1 Tax=Tanacetum coccineum TaxID=301880 RepID=A0ABQ5AM28_9ASTR